MLPNANDLLMGGGIPSIKWGEHTIGYTVVGTITDQPKVSQMTKFQSTELDYWPSGDPKLQIVVTLQTEQRDPANPGDDGKRRLYIEPRMMQAVREAILRTGAKGLTIGGQLAVRWVSGSGLGEGNARVFAADYAPPAVDPGSLLNGNGNGHTAAAPAAASTVPASPSLASMMAPPAPAAPLAAPPGVDPAVWSALPETQRNAVLAAMSNPAASAPPF